MDIGGAADVDPTAKALYESPHERVKVTEGIMSRGCVHRMASL